MSGMDKDWVHRAEMTSRCADMRSTLFKNNRPAVTKQESSPCGSKEPAFCKKSVLCGHRSA